MLIQHRIPDQAVRADPWTLYCAECAHKMKIKMAVPAREGREIRTYECACGHSESIDVDLASMGNRPSGSFAGFQQRYRSFQNKPAQQLQDTSVKATAASLSEPEATKGSPIDRTTKNRNHPLQPSMRDAMLAAVPSLRGFAITLCGNVDRADDFVQETLLRAIASIHSFQPGTNLTAWMVTILRNLFRSDYRKRRREVEDPDGGHVESLKSPPEQYSRMEFEEFRRALAQLPSDQREALLLVGASGFSYEEAAAICEIAVGTIKSRVHRARLRLTELLGIDSADELGPDQTTRAILTRGRCG